MQYPLFPHCGPFNKVDKKEPRSRLDRICWKHDRSYGKINKKHHSGSYAYSHWNRADEVMLFQLKKLKKKSLSKTEWAYVTGEIVLLKGKKTFFQHSPDAKLPRDMWTGGYESRNIKKRSWAQQIGIESPWNQEGYDSWSTKRGKWEQQAEEALPENAVTEHAPTKEETDYYNLPSNDPDKEEEVFGDWDNWTARHGGKDPFHDENDDEEEKEDIPDSKPVTAAEANHNAKGMGYNRRKRRRTNRGRVRKRRAVLKSRADKRAYILDILTPPRTLKILDTAYIAPPAAGGKQVIYSSYTMDDRKVYRNLLEEVAGSSNHNYGITNDDQAEYLQVFSQLRATLRNHSDNVAHVEAWLITPRYDMLNTNVLENGNTSASDTLMLKIHDVQHKALDTSDQVDYDLLDQNVTLGVSVASTAHFEMNSAYDLMKNRTMQKYFKIIDHQRRHSILPGEEHAYNYVSKKKRDIVPQIHAKGTSGGDPSSLQFNPTAFAYRTCMWVFSVKGGLANSSQLTTSITSGSFQLFMEVQRVLTMKRISMVTPLYDIIDLREDVAIGDLQEIVVNTHVVG